ncbi:MAG: TIGR03862 family flavoprotein [Alphaproteobacteria bacterium]|nr:TIGR03862 family flavoprotein [Alphaproteobacteria bacterium]
MTEAVVIGAGPAGLMAAEMLADRGHEVLVVEAKTTVGRKFLMAGKSGLNLTKDEPFERFISRYDEAERWLEPMLRDFGNRHVQDWARELGQEVFTGTSGRVFPRAMKSSPLLRAWLARLAAKSVRFQTRWRWSGWQGDELAFTTPDGVKTLAAKTVVLALGGASWPRLGSDGAWHELLAQKGVALSPFKPANMGFDVNWSAHMARFFGHPVKPCALIVGAQTERGEFVITKTGLEGGGIYAVSKAIREGGQLMLDLMPDRTAPEIATRLARPRGKMSLGNHLRKTYRLDPERIALLQEFARPLPSDPADLAALIKRLPIKLEAARPLSEAISTAGGVAQSALDAQLMIKSLPGIFCAGEMLDWEAPTGGYLITACLTTGRVAGLGAAKYLDG